MGYLHCASYYLYNVRAWFITFLKQNKNAILRNWRQCSEKLINMCFIHFLHCLLIRWVFLAKIMMAYCSNINNVSWKQQQCLVKMQQWLAKTISVVAKNNSNTWRKWQCYVAGIIVVYAKVRSVPRTAPSLPLLFSRLVFLFPWSCLSFSLEHLFAETISVL